MTCSAHSVPSNAEPSTPRCAEGERPRVTIIVNCYNGAEFLAEALDSALAQTYTDWELLLYDDCSTDGSAAVFERYSDARLRYVRAPRLLNLSQARQAALVLAHGEWIAFLDQDDIWLPDKLARQMAIADQDLDGKVGLVYGRAKRFGARHHGRDFDHHFEDTALPEGDVFPHLADGFELRAHEHGDDPSRGLPGYRTAARAHSSVSRSLLLAGLESGLAGARGAG
ncbi:MAG: glycosyltransferase family 2 protein [Proteobacteria bacterium]|nr:glycosyltransferase family 2 protein [Pseudomonadota bacterium]